MSGVRIVTDSACDLSPELAASLDIRVVPLTIRFGSDEFVDRQDLTPEAFWARCAASSELPETAAPSPGSFQAAFEEAAAAGADGVVCITISSKLSATYQSALAGAQAASIPVRVIDSESVTMGQGLLAVAAAEDAQRGVGLEELSRLVAERVGRVRVLGAIDSLDHLQRGGRIGGAAALLGSLLSIKPVIQVRDGVVAEESKQRTRSRSLDYLANLVRQAAPLERLAVIDGAAKDLDQFLAKLGGVAVEHERLVVSLGPVVGTHAGPGIIGVAFLVAP